MDFRVREHLVATYNVQSGRAAKLTRSVGSSDVEVEARNTQRTLDNLVA
jgi:hypothetical protein